MCIVQCACKMCKKNIGKIVRTKWGEEDFSLDSSKNVFLMTAGICLLTCRYKCLQCIISFLDCIPAFLFRSRVRFTPPFPITQGATTITVIIFVKERLKQKINEEKYFVPPLLSLNSVKCLHYLTTRILKLYLTNLKREWFWNNSIFKQILKLVELT